VRLPTTCRARTGATRDWTHGRIRREAASVGPDTAVLVDVILRSRPHPEQGFRSCIGILGLVKRFGTARVDAACARALVLGTRSYNSVATILKNHRENVPAADGGGACSDPREHPRGPMSIIYIHGVKVHSPDNGTALGK